MGVTVHWLEGQIRWGKDHAIYGDDWTTIVTVQRVGTTAHLSGGLGDLPPEALREIQQALWREGFRSVSWERSKGGHMQPKPTRLILPKSGLNETTPVCPARCSQ
jgi:hypothetical protein